MFLHALLAVVEALGANAIEIEFALLTLEFFDAFACGIFESAFLAFLTGAVFEAICAVLKDRTVMFLPIFGVCENWITFGTGD